MVEPVREWLARDGHAKFGGGGEVGQALPSGRVLLAEDHVALGAVQRLPVADAPLQRAAHARRQVGVAAEHLLEQGDRAKPGSGLQHGHDLGVPDRREGIGAAPAARRLALGGKPGVGVEPGAGAGADARTRRGELPGLGLAVVHVQSRLLVGDVRAGHEAIPWGRKPRHSGTNLTPPQAGPGPGPTPPALTYGRATPRLRSAPAITILIDAKTILIVAEHPDAELLAPVAASEGNWAEQDTSDGSGRTEPSRRSPSG